MLYQQYSYVIPGAAGPGEARGMARGSAAVLFYF